MKKDIRRAIETLVPDAKWDFSIPNDGGNEQEYNNITWKDERTKPTWTDIVSTCDTFTEIDLQQYREGLVNGPVQIRRALREKGYKESLNSWLETTDEDTKDDWDYATEIKRLDPMVLSFQAHLGASDEQVDELFELGLTLA